jgi:hypothetical protein
LDKNEPKRRWSKWMVFISMPLQMGITIYLFYLGGKWLDKTTHVQGEWFMKGCTLLGIVVSLYYFIKQANQISKNE